MKTKKNLKKLIKKTTKYETKSSRENLQKQNQLCKTRETLSIFELTE